MAPSNQTLSTLMDDIQTNIVGATVLPPALPIRYGRARLRFIPHLTDRHRGKRGEPGLLDQGRPVSSIRHHVEPEYTRENYNSTG